MIGNMQYIFSNGIINPHFSNAISVFYNRNYLSHLPFGVQDQC
jgi:hypothetical protein